MHSIEKDTLAYQLKSRPGTIYRDMSDLQIKQLSVRLNEYMDDEATGHAQPEHDAIWFYMSNHAVAEVRQLFELNQPLGEFLPLIDEYQTMLSEKAVRMFYYILLITTREARHLHNGDYKSTIASKYGDSFAQFQDALSSKGSEGAAQWLRTNPPETKLGYYCDALVDLFNNGSFSGGYGGKAWGEVSHCIREFVYGRYSAEMMMDTAFTLCHNNGPIFNKGMLYNSYNKSSIMMILDIQRSGQVPQMVADPTQPNGYITDEHREWQQKAQKLIGESFGGYVDWYLVEALGSMNNYPSQKSDQKDKHGEPASVAKAQMEAEKKKLHKEMAEAAAKAQEEQDYFTVMPGVKVKKIVRKVA